MRWVLVGDDFGDQQFRSGQVLLELLLEWPFWPPFWHHSRSSALYGTATCSLSGETTH